MERNLASSLLPCVLAMTATSQEGSPACLLGNNVPVCSYMKCLIRKSLASGSIACLFALLSGHQYFLLFSSSLPSNGELATVVLEELYWQSTTVCTVQPVSPCCRGHAWCVSSGCKSHHYPVWYNKKMGACTVVWRKYCYSHSQTAQVCWNDGSWW